MTEQDILQLRDLAEAGQVQFKGKRPIKRLAILAGRFMGRLLAFTIGTPIPFATFLKLPSCQILQHLMQTCL